MEYTPRVINNNIKPKSILKSNNNLTGKQTNHMSRKPGQDVSPRRDISPRRDVSPRRDISPRHHPVKHTSPAKASRANDKSSKEEVTRQRENLAAFRFKPRVNERNGYRPTSDFRALSKTGTVSPVSPHASLLNLEPATRSEKSETIENHVLTKDALDQHNVDYDGHNSDEIDDDLKSTTIAFTEDKRNVDDLYSSNTRTSAHSQRRSTPRKEDLLNRTPQSEATQIVQAATTESRRSTAQQSRRSAHTPGSKSVKIDNNPTPIEQSPQHRASVNTWAEEPMEPRGQSRNGDKDVEITSLGSVTEGVGQPPEEEKPSRLEVEGPKDEPSREEIVSKSSNNYSLPMNTRSPSVTSKSSTPKQSGPPSTRKEPSFIKSPRSDPVSVKSPRQDPNIKPMPRATQNTRSNAGRDQANKENIDVPKQNKSSTTTRKPKESVKVADSKSKVKKPSDNQGKGVKKEQHKNKIVFKVKASNQVKPDVPIEKPSVEPSRQSSAKQASKPKKVVSIKAKANTSGAKNNKPKPKPTKAPSPDFGSRIDLESLSDDGSLDIFELARQRYGIDLDSDTDSIM